jgi:predicted DNA-binding transcriptional regulator YafY
LPKYFNDFMETFTHQKHQIHRKQMRYSVTMLDIIGNSIDNCRLVTIEYHSFEKGTTIRDLEPMALIYKDRRRNLLAWCRLRNEYRTFRLDRIECIKLRQEEFERRQDLRIDDYQDDPSATYQEDEYDDY